MGVLRLKMELEELISGTSDKASGIANEAIGKAKQGGGNVVGSDSLMTERAHFLKLRSHDHRPVPRGLKVGCGRHFPDPGRDLRSQGLRVPPEPAANGEIHPV